MIQLCDYGCRQPAKKYSRYTKKWCCSEKAHLCPNYSAWISPQISKSRSKKSKTIKQRFQIFDDFLDFVREKRSALNFNNTDIIASLEKVYRANSESRFTNDKVRIYITSGLNLRYKNKRKLDFWIERGFSEEYGREQVRILQSNSAQRAVEKGAWKGRFTKEWFQERYPDDWEERYNEKHQSTSPSLENQIRRHGEEEGTRRYKEDSKNRSSTLENFIRRHGKKEGEERWKEYCERQRYTNTVEYFIEKYGEIEGPKRWEKSFGGLGVSSLVSKELFDQIVDMFSIDRTKIYYYDNEWKIFLVKEERILLKKTLIKPDFKYENKIIEFFGDNVHGNPKKFKANDLLTYYRHNHKSAQLQWSQDLERLKVISDRGFDVLIVWEGDYREDPASIIQECGEFLLG